MRHQIDAPVLSNDRVGMSEYEIVLDCPPISRDSRPGQFLQLRYSDGYNPYLRRPFSVFRADPTTGKVAIVYLARGVFTYGLAGLHPGAVVSVVGPLGNAYSSPADPRTTHILVAGGVGAPPMYMLAEHLMAARSGVRVIVVNGARSRELLVAAQEFAALGIDVRTTTDDGSAGRRGLVTDELTDILEFAAHPQVYACGPTPMLRAVGELCVDRSVECQVSLETLMPCGAGVCMGCVVKLRDAEDPSGFTYARSCSDGPIFDAKDVIW